MTKCHDVLGFQELAGCLLADIHGFLPLTTQEYERDLSRLHSLIKNRGVGFLTLTLPEAGKIFDQALANGRLEKLALPGFKPIGGKVSAVIPVFLQGIWLRVFDESGLLREDPCIQALSGLRQFFYCFKKVRLDCDPTRVRKTLEEFYRVDASLRLPSLDYGDGGCFDDRRSSALHISDGADVDDGTPTFDGIEPLSRCDPGLLETVQQSMDCLASTLGEFNAEEWKPKHGRGAVADGRLGTFLKYEFPTWSARLERSFPASAFGFPNYGAWSDYVHDDLVEGQRTFMDRDPPSRLITVPKTMKGPRLIAAEPTSYQFCQQAILSYLVAGVRASPLGKAIAFETQEPNRQAALDASRSGELATIDLSSASDCVSCWLVERAFRRNKSLLRALFDTRTSWLEDRVSTPPRFHKLRKFTTMGAATTFPVQSIIYAALAAGVIAHETGTTVTSKNLSQIMSLVRVYGDDIIVPVRYAEKLVEVLSYLGFSVNPAKTFAKGNFRESCGMDAYAGVEVTPSYILETYDELRPSSIESVRQCANNLFERGMWRTAEALERTVPPKFLNELPVVVVGSGVPGRSSFVGNDVSHLRRRWDGKLQRDEVRMVRVSTQATRKSVGGNASLLQYFLEAPNPTSMVTWSSGYDERPTARISRRWVPVRDLGE